MDLHYT